MIRKQFWILVIVAFSNTILAGPKADGADQEFTIKESSTVVNSSKRNEVFEINTLVLTYPAREYRLTLAVQAALRRVLDFTRDNVQAAQLYIVAWPDIKIDIKDIPPYPTKTRNLVSRRILTIRDWIMETNIMEDDEISTANMATPIGLLDSLFQNDEYKLKKAVFTRDKRRISNLPYHLRFIAREGGPRKAVVVLRVIKYRKPSA